jgi:hypothetical protein
VKAKKTTRPPAPDAIVLIHGLRKITRRSEVRVERCEGITVVPGGAQEPMGYPFDGSLAVKGRCDGL